MKRVLATGGSVHRAGSVTIPERGYEATLLREV